MHKDFARILTTLENLGQLNASFWSYDASGEYRTKKTGALLKAKGLKPGQSDFKIKTIKNEIAHLIYIEFKTLKGKQSPFQKNFQNSCIGKNESYYIARSIDEAINILIDEVIIKYEHINHLYK